MKRSHSGEVVTPDSPQMLCKPVALKGTLTEEIETIKLFYDLQTFSEFWLSTFHFPNRANCMRAGHSSRQLILSANQTTTQGYTKQNYEKKVCYYLILNLLKRKREIINYTK